MRVYSENNGHAYRFESSSVTIWNLEMFQVETNRNKLMVNMAKAKEQKNSFPQILEILYCWQRRLCDIERVHRAKLLGVWLQEDLRMK